MHDWKITLFYSFCQNFHEIISITKKPENHTLHIILALNWFHGKNFHTTVFLPVLWEGIKIVKYFLRIFATWFYLFNVFNIYNAIRVPLKTSFFNSSSSLTYMEEIHSNYRNKAIEYVTLSICIVLPWQFLIFTSWW